MLRLSSSRITNDFLSGPIKILSFASSKSCIVTVRLFRRAAKSAASLTKLAKSAPENPGVPLAKILASTSSSIGTLRMCTSNICSRPLISGSETATCRSNRPGLNNALSKTSARFVAAITMTPELASKPSISTNN